MILEKLEFHTQKNEVGPYVISYKKLLQMD